MLKRIILCITFLGLSYYIWASFFAHSNVSSEKAFENELYHDIGYIKKEALAIHTDGVLLKNSTQDEIKMLPKQVNKPKSKKKINSFGNPIVDFSGFSNEGEGAGTIGLWPDMGNILDDNLESAVIYISNWHSKQLISCNVNKSYYNPATAGGSNGSGVTPTGLYNCQIINKLNLNSPENMLVNNGTLYIVDAVFIGNSFITSCKIMNNGTLTNCSNEEVQMRGATFINIDANRQIIVSAFPERNKSTMVACQASALGGKITFCGSATVVDEALIPKPIVNGFEYKTDTNNNAIDKCVDGVCQLLTNQLFNKPIGIFISQNTVYVANGNNTVIGCGVDQSSGSFFNCTTLASGLDSPAGITQVTLNNN